MQQFQPLGFYLHVHLCHARDIATWAVKAGDEAEPDWVAGAFEDDRNCRGRRLCRKCRRSSGRGNHGHLAMNQVRGQSGNSIVMFLRPAVFDRDVLTFDVARFIEPLAECGCEGHVAMARPHIEIANQRHRRLLCTGLSRPCDYSAAERRYEFAPSRSSCHVTLPWEVMLT